MLRSIPATRETGSSGNSDAKKKKGRKPSSLGYPDRSFEVAAHWWSPCSLGEGMALSFDVRASCDDLLTSLVSVCM